MVAFLNQLPLTFDIAGHFQSFPKLISFGWMKVLKMVSLPVSITASLLFQYLLLLRGHYTHLNEGIDVEVCEQRMTLRCECKSSAALLLHCCTSQG